ncbi:MAG: Arc family DNA-binding protein [Oscillospiraceae bacterium]|jgi:hypothetical protein|nr:Arc family DNA-binding protein [Oscillospiraceae bacterium]
MPKSQLTLRLDDDILDKLKVIADKERRSINSQYEYFLAKAIERYEAENGTIDAES